ncbi:hypothetical protein RND71_003231 [Anisodus tanguticus]|uniref:Uncharacterized protein n=1 Tax=Anisodus tanguticus TaxID=243964 RepID=A0AAE1SVI5_9SOLA|nr:hypothetical protein RND71_003231 [Anisodus tanguticus]
MWGITRFLEKLYILAEGGSGNCSKKKDDICNEEVMGSSRENSLAEMQEAGRALSMSRLKCVLRGLDLKTYIFLFLLVPTCVFGIYLHGQKITYFLRPLWEKPPNFHEMPHYYHENVSMENLCKLHGWGIRKYPRRVFDAVLFSNELEILTIRWKELYPYITEFVLLAIHRDQFEFVESRLTYGQIPGRFREGENPFVEEAYQRLALDISSNKVVFKMMIC